MAKHIAWSIDDDGVLTWVARRGLHLRRGQARRSLRDPHQSAGKRTRRPRHGARLQAAQLRGAGLPQPEDRGLEGSAPSSTAPSPGSAPTSSCACWPTTWSGTCAGSSSPCYSTTRMPRAPRPYARPSWPRRRSRRAPGPRRPRRQRPTAIRCTACAPSSTISHHHPQHRGPRLPGAEPFRVTTRPTPLQTKVFELLGVKP